MTATAPRPVLLAEIDYIEVEMPSADRASCRACDDARSRLDKAIASVAPLFDQLGIHPRVRRLEVRTAREAELLKVNGSPTIRIGGLDLHPEHRDGEAGEIGEARIWHWQGREFSLPPVEMLTQALLRVAVEPATLSRRDYRVPEYLKRFVAEEIAA